MEHERETFVVDAGQTHNFSSVTRPSTGSYCLELSPASGISAADRPAVVSVNKQLTAGPAEGNATAQIDGICGTNGIAVRTTRRPSGTATDADVLADDVGFDIIVP